jgi:hypothetical protein
MRKVAVAWIALSLCVGAHLYAVDQQAITIPEIAKYYQDLNFVAATSTPAEQMTIISYMNGLSHNEAFLRDPRLRLVYETIKSMKSVGYSLDPRILRLPTDSVQINYTYRADPIEVVSQDSDRVVLKIRRSVVTAVVPSIPAKGKQKDRLADKTTKDKPGHFSFGSRNFAFTEIDVWLLIGNKWRIWDFHAYPVSRSIVTPEVPVGRHEQELNLFSGPPDQDQFSRGTWDSKK